MAQPDPDADRHANAYAHADRHADPDADANANAWDSHADAHRNAVREPESGQDDLAGERGGLDAGNGGGVGRRRADVQMAEDRRPQR